MRLLGVIAMLALLAADPAGPRLRYLQLDADQRAQIAVDETVLHVAQGDAVARPAAVKSINEEEVAPGGDMTDEEKQTFRRRLRYLGLDPDGRAQIAIDQTVLHVAQGDTVAGWLVMKSISDDEVVLRHDLTDAEKEARRARGVQVYEADEMRLPNLSLPPFHFRRWGPFEGTVVDAESGKPIPGAIVVAVWIRLIPFPVQDREWFNDARLAVTDRDGHFEIPRRTLPFLPFLVPPPVLLCAAPGYQDYQYVGKRNAPITIQLQPLSPGGWQRSYSLVLDFIPFGMHKEFENIINLKRREMGLSSTQLETGSRNQRER